MSLLETVMTTQQDPNEVFYVFYNRIPNSTIYFPDGSAAIFLGGRYATNDESKATFLLQEIKRGHMYLHIDEAKFEVTAAQLDPDAEYRTRIIAEYEASKAANTNADAGTSDQGKLKTVTTATVGGAAVNSSSGTQALVMGLKASAAPAAPAAQE